MPSHKSYRYLKSKSNKYISQNLLSWLGIVLLVIMGVIFLFESVEKLRTMIGREGVTLDFLISIVLLRLPQHMIDFMPFLFFISTLISLWKLNQNYELIALRASGVSGSQLALGLFITSIFVGILSVTILNPIASSCNARYVNMEERVLKKNHQKLAISSTGFWLREAEGKHQNIFHAQSFSFKERMFYEGTFYIFNTSDQLEQRIHAKKIEIFNGEWRLHEVSVWQNDDDIKHFISYSLPTQLTFEKIQKSAISPKHIPFWQLPSRIAELQKNGMSAHNYSVYWHRLWAEILLLGCMTVLAVGFCMTNPRNNTTGQLILMAVISGFIIHFLNKVIYSLGEADRLSAFWAAWLPPIITGLVSLSYLMHAEERT